MAHIGTIDFYLNVPSLPPEEFEQYTTKLFDDWEKYVSPVLGLSDYSLTLHVEEGSIKGVGKIVASLGALSLFIGQYGSFVSGLQTIRDQVNDVEQYLGEHASKSTETKSVKPKIRKRGEDLARLQGLFTKVQNRQMTVEEAMEESKKFLGAEADHTPEFMQGLKSSLEQTPQVLDQIEIPFEGLQTDKNEELMLPSKENKQKTKLPPIPPPPSHQLRIEVWRKRKKGKRHIKIIHL